ncbi:hypothetical protein LC55x_3155 [Lysobacter capsici]|nr:hypothetical protein LC55x_3155 [Lysobacter capsici]
MLPCVVAIGDPSRRRIAAVDGCPRRSGSGVLWVNGPATG